MKDAKQLEESLLEIHMENIIHSDANPMATKINAKNDKMEMSIQKLIDNITNDSTVNRRKSSTDVGTGIKHLKNRANASIYCSDLPLENKDELIRLCKLIIETHCIDALTLDELRLLHEFVYTAGLRKQTFKFPHSVVDLRQQQIKVDQLKQKLSGSKLRISELKSKHQLEMFSK